MHAHACRRHVTSPGAGWISTSPGLPPPAASPSYPDGWPPAPPPPPDPPPIPAYPPYPPLGGLDKLRQELAHYESMSPLMIAAITVGSVLAACLLLCLVLFLRSKLLALEGRLAHIDRQATSCLT